ncbi:MAG: FMN-binding negative transcriptional regulator [Litorimonas sp.]
MSYPPPYYTDDDPAFARRIMAEHGFALLVAGDLEATHLPLLFRDEGEAGSLYGHVSRSNPVAESLDGGAGLAVFSGPHGYVSATLYDDPTRSVPTWNYASVQARGRLSVLPDDAVGPHLAEMAQAYEGRTGWSVSDAPDYVARLRGGIVAFRLEIDSLRAFRKMSGNKSRALRKRIVDAARARGEHGFADEMTLYDMTLDHKDRAP